MTPHARPHLQTHTRSSDHSAVAGAAYRLGLKLLDERTSTWHDFHRRSLRGEIILALTIAPEGSPDWATQPQALWNRAEFAEKRKDAQVARDYRIPVPLGLSAEQAGILAEQMAHFIADNLKTPVSVGVHRDSEVDVLGQKKVAEKVGYHAHLYFPTRRLACFEEGPAAEKAVYQDEIGEGTGFGSKLSMLSNKRTSAAFVEQLNTRWAELANQLCSLAGLPVEYDHRSYARQGVDVTPQPTVGQVATAMERKELKSRLGSRLRDALKATDDSQEIVVEPVSIDVAHVGQDPITAEDKGAVSSYVWLPSPQPPLASSSPISQASTPAPSASQPEITTPTNVTDSRPSPGTPADPDFREFQPGGRVIFLTRLQERRDREVRSSDTSSRGGQRPEVVNQVVAFSLERKRERLEKRRNDSRLSSAFVIDEASSPRKRSRQPSSETINDRWRQEIQTKNQPLFDVKEDSIAAKLLKNLPQPFMTADRARFHQSLALVACLEKVLATLEAAQEDEEKKTKAYERAKAAALDADFQVDQARASRKVARARWNLWTQNRVKAYGLWKVITSGRQRAMELEDDLRWKNDLVQAAKRASERLHAFSKEALRVLQRVQGQLTNLRRELAVTAVDLRLRNARMFEEFTRWLSLRQRRILDAAMPVAPEVEPKAEEGVEAGTTGEGGASAQRGMAKTEKTVPKLAPEVGKQFKR